MPRAQVQELAPGAWPIRREGRIRVFDVLLPGQRDLVARRVFPQLIGRELVWPRGVEPEYLGAQGGSDGRITVLRAQRLGDLEGTERLDLVLRRAVPDRIGAPEHIVLADVLEQFADG